MTEIKSTSSYAKSPGLKIFLAGSIEMGAAGPWQDQLVKQFANQNVTFLNPRRDDWDSSWIQDISNLQFNQQVTWELDGLAACDYAVFYFDPNTKSPITLMELGLMAASGKIIVCCPKGFWRKGNVDIVCDRNNILVVETLDQLAIELAKIIE